MWADYLSKISPEWKQKVGANSSLNWPVGVGGKGNEGVAGLVTQTPGSLGYVELVYALQNKISYGAVQNRPASSSARSSNRSRPLPPAPCRPCRRISACRSRIRQVRAPIPSRRSPGFCCTRTRRTRTRRKVINDFMKWALNDGQTMAGRRWDMRDYPTAAQRWSSSN